LNDQEPTGLFANGCHFLRGRVALYAILKALGIGAGDEVIVQAFTCCAVPLPILGTGARAVFADVDLATFNLDPASVAARVTSRSKAIVVQHTFGIPADMDALLQIARSRGLLLIEDCCHTLASSYGGTLVGHFGDAAFTAYRWGKPLVLGIGGTAVIHPEASRKRLQAIHQAARIPGILETARFCVEYIGHQLLLHPSTYWVARDAYRRLVRLGLAVATFPKAELEGALADGDIAMPPFQAERLAERIGSVFEAAEYRRRIAARYATALSEYGARTCVLDRKCDPVFLRYPLLSREKERVLELARKRRIEVGDWFVSAIHPHSDSQCDDLGYRKGMCPAAELAGSQILTLPIRARAQEHEADRVLDFLGELHKHRLL